MEDDGVENRDNRNNGHDPLAQTFLVEEEDGCFLTKVDVFYQQKDDVLPTYVEIRNVVNGYPNPKVLPFGRKLLHHLKLMCQMMAQSQRHLCLTLQYFYNKVMSIVLY